MPSCLIWFAHNSQKEKKNLQDSAGVYVYNVGDREELDRPTAKLIEDLSCIEGNTPLNELFLGDTWSKFEGYACSTFFSRMWFVDNVFG